MFPRLGARLISAINAPELLAVLRRAEAQELGETPRRLRQYCGQIFRYAIATGRAERDPAADLRGALKPHKVQHHAAVTEPKEVGALLRAIQSFHGSFVTKAALQGLPHLCLCVLANLDALYGRNLMKIGVWRIPAERMKMRDAHIVPLSRQAITILRELEPITNAGDSPTDGYVFPSV